ncbi:radical SAM protein [bacterium]|nr:radical SAM protein [bacterium]
MKLNSIFQSIQGEGRFQGYPSDFIRFFGCNLNCSYCDTKYTLSGDSFYFATPEEAAEKLNKTGVSDLCITGGEPMCQEDELLKLLKLLKGKRISLETNGSLELEPLYRAFSAVKTGSQLFFSTDWKTPSSGNPVFDERNIDFLRKSGAGWIKFVTGSSEDLDFIDAKLPFLDGVETYLSPVFENGRDWFSAVEKFVKSHKNIRLQLQLHKILGIE